MKPRFDFNSTGASERCGMHCRTEYEANTFLIALSRLGRTWSTGRKYTEYNYFEDFKEDTVYYYNNGTYGNIVRADRRATIFEFSDYNWDIYEDNYELSDGDLEAFINGSMICG